MGGALIWILAAAWAVLVAVLWVCFLLLGWSVASTVTWSLLALVPFGAIYTVMRLLALRREKQFERRISAQGITSTGAGGGSEAEMGDQFRKGLKVIRESHFQRTALTELPWYLVIGAPGSGKSTALRESGLSFPSLGDGLRSFRGIGGTRNCDWWITEEAFFLDTAGRYTTRPDDRQEWLAFLDLLRRYRRSQAINGIIVTASVPELLKKDEAGLEAHAQIIRDRIEEISGRLDLHLPVYILFTKCDLIGGFKDFFAGLDQGERDQVFGTSLDWPPPPEIDYGEVFRAETAALAPRITTRRLHVLGAIGDEADAGLIKAIRFPAQLQQVQDIMARFITAVFRPGPIRAQAGLRGFFFTSATQPGSDKGKADDAAETAPVPAASVMPAGEERSIFIAPGGGGLAAAPGGERRSGLFLRNLFAKLIIADRKLAGASARHLARRRLLRLAAMIGSPVLALLLVLLIGGALLSSRSIALEAGAAAERLAGAASDATPVGGRLADLDHLRALLQRLDEDPPLGLGDFRPQVAEVYYRHLRDALLAPVAGGLQAEIEDKLAEEQRDVEHLFELQVAYKILGGVLGSAPDQDLATTRRLLLENDRWFAALGEGGGDRHLAERQLVQLASHPDDHERWAVALDRRFLDKVDAQLGESLLIRSGYQEVLGELDAALPPITRDVLVSGAHRDLVRNEYRFPGLFSSAGWQDLVRARLADKADELVRKLTDLGKPQPRDAVLRRLAELFRNDRDRHWLELTRQTRVSPAPNLRESVRRLVVITGPQSPHAELLRQAWRELQSPVAIDGTAAPAGDEQPAWLKDALDRIDQLGRLVQRFESAGDVGRRSEDPARLEELVIAYEDTRQALATSLREIAEPRHQAAMRAALEAIASSTFDALAAELATELDRDWQVTVRTAFATELTDRWPFAQSPTEVPLDRFAALFNPVDGVVTKRIALARRLGGLKAFDRSLVELDRSFLHFGERVATLSGICFAPDSQRLEVPLAIQLEQRQGVKDMMIVVGDHVFKLYDTPDRRTTCSWSQGARPGAKVAISIVDDDWLTLSEDGAWGLLRLLAKTEVERRASGGWTCSWTLTSQKLGGEARFQASLILQAPMLDPWFAQRDLFLTTVCPERVTP